MCYRSGELARLCGREVQSLAPRKLEETAIRITEQRKLQSRLKAPIEQWDYTTPPPKRPASRNSY